MPHKDKATHNAYMREYKRKHKEQCRATAKAYNARTRFERKLCRELGIGMAKAREIARQKLETDKVTK